MKGLYKFYVGVGRGRDIEGLFIANSKEVKELIGKDVYFGEICGKHSEVEFEIKEEHIIFVANNPEVIHLVEKFKLENGINPIQQWKENMEDGIYDEEDE